MSVAQDGTDRGVHVQVEPLPRWLDVERFLGEAFARSADGEAAEACLPREAAAELSARLRGLGVAGRPLSVRVTPALARSLVRAGRLAEARARRATTPGFTRAGARASGEGRYSLTPEPLALHLAAEFCARATSPGKRVVDACCGSGGNALGFARAGCEVVAIDVDSERLAEAAHNAALYGVAGRIRFVHGDALALLPGLSGDLLFFDPPWGRDYDKRAVTRADLPLLDRLLALPSDQRAGFAACWLKLPPSFATPELPGAELRAMFGEAPGDVTSSPPVATRVTWPRLAAARRAAPRLPVTGPSGSLRRRVDAARCAARPKVATSVAWDARREDEKWQRGEGDSTKRRTAMARTTTYAMTTSSWTAW